MKKPLKAEILGVAEQLINLPDTEQARKWLDLLEPVVDAGVSFNLTGDTSFLQPMLELRRHDIKGYARIMAAIDTQREQTGLGKLGDKQGRDAYMRSFMKLKRSRESDYLKSWNMMFSDRESLKGDKAKLFKRNLSQMWLDYKNQRLTELRRTLGRQTLTREEGRAELDKADLVIDEDLERLRDFANSELRKPVTQRNPNSFKPLAKARDK